ncbi:MAG: WS/DGAT/MGAT family O-acyltransferase [Acidimicrobiia bacterium]
MQRLTGLDAAFLSIETPSAPLHVAGLLVLDPAEAPGGFDFERVRAFFGSRLHLAPPFRRRAVPVPLGLHHPVWIEDPDFDLDYHLRHVAVPAPGDHRQLAELASRLMSQPLDRDRPLWEVWVIEGLDGGHVALLAKIHHCAIDGVAGVDIGVAILQMSPDEVTPPPSEPWQPDPVPNRAELLAAGVAALASQPRALARTARRTIDTLLRLRERNRQPGADAPPRLFSAPATSFNGAVTARRALAFTSLSLADAKAVKNAFGATVNDVILAVCGGAMRAYLEHLGEDPGAPLVAMVPMSVRTEVQQGTHGNRVSPMFCSLATDVADPVERLGLVREGMLEAKDHHETVGATTWQDWAEFATPALVGGAARLYSWAGIADRHRPPFNLIVSNVVGPPFPLYSAGARLVAYYPLGPVHENIGLNVTVMSYMGHLDFGLVCCQDLIADPWVVAEAMHESMDELVKAAARLSS